MRSEWVEMELCNFVEITMGQSPLSKYYNDSGVGLPFLQGNRTFGPLYPTVDTWTRKATRLALPNDILMSVRAPVGALNIANKEVCIGRGLCSLRAKNEQHKFLYYLLKNSVVRLVNKESGTVFGSVNKKDIETLKVAIPSVKTQQSISNILSCLDKKIELNNKINENLEQQAQVIFKSWFVDFEPFQDGKFVESELGMIPEGWEVRTIGDLGEVVGGSTPSKKKPEYYTNNGIPWLTPRDLSTNGNKFVSKGEIDITNLGFENSSVRKMPKGTVLFSSRAPIGYIAIAQNEVTTNQGFKSVVPKTNIGTEYVYFFLKNNINTIEARASGSTFKEVSGRTMTQTPALIPNGQVLTDFSHLLRPYFKQQELLETENKILSVIRDTLLPKLMNGEIEVPIE